MKSSSAAESTTPVVRQLGAISLEATFYLLIALLPFSALLLCWRRLAGALRPASVAVLLAIAVAWVFTRLAAEFVLQLRRAPDSSLRERLLFSVSVFAVAGSLSVPDTSPFGLMLLWGMLLTSEAIFWRVSLVSSKPRKRTSRPKQPNPNEVSKAPATSPDEAFLEAALDDIEMLETTPGDQVIQQMTRVLHSGVETITGRHWVAFEPGGRTESVHLSFCPPFAKTPQFDVEPIDGPPVKIKQIRLLPQGVRLDLKLEHETDEPAAVGLEFTAWLESH